MIEPRLEYQCSLLFVDPTRTPWSATTEQGTFLAREQTNSVSELNCFYTWPWKQNSDWCTESVCLSSFLKIRYLIINATQHFYRASV
jgi:hypothetical protein